MMTSFNNIYELYSFDYLKDVNSHQLVVLYYYIIAKSGIFMDVKRQRRKQSWLPDEHFDPYLNFGEIIKAMSFEFCEYEK